MLQPKTIKHKIILRNFNLYKEKHTKRENKLNIMMKAWLNKNQGNEA